MEYKDLESLVKDGLSIRQIAIKTGCSCSNVRYWVQKFGLKTKKIVEYRCPCGEENPKNFYGHKKNICGRCHNEYVKEKGLENRKRMVESLGGRCVSCGYSEYSCSLDIHHTDSKKKDPNFSTTSFWSWKRTEKELKNCVLLCKNCHAALHSGCINL